MATKGKVGLLSPVPKIETPEALYLGMRPREGQLRPGPLTVAAFGLEPPERSTHFCLSLLSMTDGALSDVAELPNEEETRVLETCLARLNSRVLTGIWGEPNHHALVWEGHGDFGTTPPEVAIQKGYRDSLPEGDAEPLLRGYIDDSVNILFEQDFNRRRIDEGHLPLNVFWPWGHGFRERQPNLVLRRGHPAWVETTSIRLAGLSRLVGYRVGPRAPGIKAVNLDLSALNRRITSESLSLVVLEGPGESWAKRDPEAAYYQVREIDRRILAPWFDATEDDQRQLLVLAPETGSNGLWLHYSTDSKGDSHLPFDDRILDERGLPTQDLWTLANDALSD